MINTCSSGKVQSGCENKAAQLVEAVVEALDGGAWDIPEVVEVLHSLVLSVLILAGTNASQNRDCREADIPSLAAKVNQVITETGINTSKQELEECGPSMLGLGLSENRILVED